MNPEYSENEEIGGYAFSFWLFIVMYLKSEFSRYSNGANCDIISSDGASLSTPLTDVEAEPRRTKKARPAPVPPYIKDNRRFYCDAVVNMINSSDFVALRSFLNHHFTESAAFISCWLNSAKGVTNNRYREVTGVDSYLDYITQISLCVPDGIIEIQDRKLYLNEDNSSILVVKCTFHGLVLFDFLCKNAIHSAQQYISKYNPFSYIMRESSVVPEASSEEKFVNELTNRQNMIKSKRKRDQENSNYIHFFSRPTLARERKITSDQIEVSQQQTSKFMLGQVRRKPKHIRVSATVLYHINADYRIYRAEVFKRFEVKLFGTY